MHSMPFITMLLAVFAFTASASAAEPSPVLDSLTSPQAEKLFQESLRKVCAGVFTSRNAQMPFASECGPWPGMQVPTACMLGLVLLGEGNTLMKGPHAATLRKLVPYVRQAGIAPHESIDNYRTWVLSFSLLFLSEIHKIAPTPELKKLLADMVKKLEDAAYADGGWGHTLEHQRNSYGSFVAVSIWTVAGLLAAKEQGVTVSDKILTQNLAWLRGSITADTGGSSYSATKRGLISPGRTAGVIWLLHHWDKTASQKQIDRGCAFIRLRVAATPEGHASGMMNFGWGGLVAGEVGAETGRDFWAAHTKTIYAARRDDGTFSPQPWRDLSFIDQKNEAIEHKQNQPTADETAGDNWAAVWMLTTWQAARGKSMLCTKAAK